MFRRKNNQWQMLEQKNYEKYETLPEQNQIKKY